MDGDHMQNCNKGGRTHVHSGSLNTLERLVKTHGGAAATWLLKEPRGTNFFNHAEALRGPDGKIDIHGTITIIDITGIAENTWKILEAYGRNGTLNYARRTLPNSGSRRSESVPPKDQTKLETRDALKEKSSDSKWTHMHNATYVACSFLTNGGISRKFNALLVKIVRDQATPFKYADGSITTPLQLSQQTLRATIVNTHAQVVMNNMKKAFQVKKITRPMAWWTAATTDDTIDTPIPFDDVTIVETEQWQSAEADDDAMFNGFLWKPAVHAYVDVGTHSARARGKDDGGGGPGGGGGAAARVGDGGNGIGGSSDGAAGASSSADGGGGAAARPVDGGL